jgi:hypothetical protein
MNTPKISGVNFYMAESKRWKIYYRDKDRSIPSKIKDKEISTRLKNKKFKKH